MNDDAYCSLSTNFSYLSLVKDPADHEGTQMAFTGSEIPRRDVFFAGTQSDLIPLILVCRAPRKCKNFLVVYEASLYILLIFILHQNKLVCTQRVSKKITRFVPLQVHILEICRIGIWNTLPRGRSGILSSLSFFLHDICLYLQ